MLKELFGAIQLIRIQEENYVIQSMTLKTHQVKKLFQKIHQHIEDHNSRQRVVNYARIGTLNSHTSMRIITRTNHLVIFSLTSVEIQMKKNQFGVIQQTQKLDGNSVTSLIDLTLKVYGEN